MNEDKMGKFWTPQFSRIFLIQLLSILSRFNFTKFFDRKIEQILQEKEGVKNVLLQFHEIFQFFVPQ